MFSFGFIVKDSTKFKYVPWS